MATTSTWSHETHGSRESLSRQEALAAFLSRTSPFSTLKATELRALAATATTLSLSRTETLYRQGEELTSLYVVQKGSLKLLRQGEGSRQIITGLVGPGQCLGGVIERRPAGSSAVALQETSLCRAPIEAARSLAVANPGFAVRLTKLLEQRWLEAQSAAARLVLASVPQRLAAALLLLCDPEDGSLQFPLSQTELAHLIGSTRETTCSILNWLRRRHLISTVNGCIHIEDRRALLHLSASHLSSSS